jgi:hypothetical protein
MRKIPQGQPTLFQSIFVGSEPNAQQAAEFFLAVADWFLKEGEIQIKVPLKGDISQWIAKVCSKPILVSVGNTVGASPAAVQRQVVKQSLNILADPRQEEERRIVGLLENVSAADMQRISEALRKEDIRALNATRAEIGERLGRQWVKSITPDAISALLALLSRMRAARAAALCAILYKVHPLSLIAQARQGDRRAVLDLVKVDKLFLHDRCTAKVIREAELRHDRPFLGQLARALASKPKLGWRRGCQLYLQALFACTPQLPALSILQLRLDPEGNRFRSFNAFEKFFERCRPDFLQFQSTVSRRSQASPRRA